MQRFSASFYLRLSVGEENSPEPQLHPDRHKAAVTSSRFGGPLDGRSAYDEPRKRRRLEDGMGWGDGDRFIAQPMTFDNRLAYRSQNDRYMRAGAVKRGGISVNGEKEMANVQGNLLRTNEQYRDVLRTIYSYNASAADSTTETTRVLTFSRSAPSVRTAAVSAESLDDARNSAYSPVPLPRRTRKKLSMASGRLREVCTSPYKTLDAPHLEDNFYLNLIDWSRQDQLACVLGEAIYVCSLENMKVNCASVQLANQPRSWSSSIHWLGDGSELATGTRGGILFMIDSVTLQEKRRFISGHTKRIGVITSQGSLVATGSADSNIIIHDQRMFQHMKTISAHRLEICSLKFNPLDPNVLASGGDDCKLFIWDLRYLSSDPTARSPPANHSFRSRLSTSSVASIDLRTLYPSLFPSSPSEFKTSDDISTPLLHLNEHRAAVRGLAWSPHVRGLLASGGGKGDPVIRFWDTKTGRKIDQVRCQAQVTNLVWSRTSDELMSTHGYGETGTPGAIIVWHYPTRLPIVIFKGHADRVLYAAASPNDGSVVTGSSDQTLRFWNIFPEKQTLRVQNFADLEGKLR